MKKKKLKKIIEGLKEELAITDQLLASRQQVLDAIPECNLHGSCVPHALEWIKEMKLFMVDQVMMGTPTCMKNDDITFKYVYSDHIEKGEAFVLCNPEDASEISKKI